MTQNIKIPDEHELPDAYPLYPGFLYVINDLVWRAPIETTAKHVNILLNCKIKNCNIKERKLGHLAI